MNATGTIARSTRFYYGFGSVAYGVKDNGFAYFLLFYYNQVLGLPGHLASAAILVALVFDALSDPIVGNVSDRLHSRWGRRHPFMYAAAVPVALSFFFLWNPPALGETELFYYLMFNAVLVRTFITFYEVPSTALAPELSPDYDQRTKLAAARHFFGWAGGITIAVVMYNFLMVETADLEGAQNPAAYQAYGALGAFMIFAAIMTSAMGTHRHIPGLMQPPPKRRASLKLSLIEARESLDSRSFYSVFGFGLFAAMAGGLSGSMSIYLGIYFWEFSPAQLGILVPAGFLSATVALFAAPRVAERFGKKQGAIGLSLLAAAFAPSIYIGKLVGVMPAGGSSELLGILIVYNIIEIGLIISSTTLVSAMIADVVEESEIKTGRRSEGVFFAARSFISKSVSGLGIMLGTLLLGAIDFPRNAKAGEVDPEIIMNMGLGYAPMIMILYCSAIACLTFYDISREQHHANIEALGERRAAN